MKIELLDLARQDLIEGYAFYEENDAGLGDWFLTNLFADIDSLLLYAGLHPTPYKHFHRALSKRFPFAIFYTVAEDVIRIHAVVDCRRRPAWIRERLRQG